MSRLALKWIVAVAIMMSVWTIDTATRQASGAAVSSGHEALGGVWSLNQDKSERPGRNDSADGGRGGRSGGGGRAGGFGGRRGGGGFGRGGDGGRDGAGGRNAEQMQAVMNYLRALTQPSDRITIVVHATSVGITDAEGMTLALQTDNKSVEQRAENGLIKLKRKSRWDGEALLTEIDIDQGPKIERRYELGPGGEGLRVSTEVTGGSGRGGGGNRTITHVYDRWRRE